MTQQWGRWLRVTKTNGLERVINLDHVSHVTHGTNGGARFNFINHDFIDTTEDFEVICLKLMAKEEPMPPLSRKQLSLVEAAASEWDRQA